MVLGEAVTLLASGDRPPGLLPAREQMAVSLGFHIILSCFGVAFPAMILAMRSRRSSSPQWLAGSPPVGPCSLSCPRSHTCCGSLRPRVEPTFGSDIQR